MWCVNTAGSLLIDHDVAQDLSIIQTERTSKIVKLAVGQRQREDYFYNSKRKAKKHLDMPRDVVTIDSRNVKLVTDPKQGQWDLEGMLIEVDGGALTDLIIKFRHLIVFGGPIMSFEETKSILEYMIEDARRLCLRSPILFRMSTRPRIINSKITRHGVDRKEMFRTLTVSCNFLQLLEATDKSRRARVSGRLSCSALLVTIRSIQPTATTTPNYLFVRNSYR